MTEPETYRNGVLSAMACLRHLTRHDVRSPSTNFTKTLYSRRVSGEGYAPKWQSDGFASTTLFILLSIARASRAGISELSSGRSPLPAALGSALAFIETLTRPTNEIRSWATGGVISTSGFGVENVLSGYPIRKRFAGTDEVARASKA